MRPPPSVSLFGGCERDEQGRVTAMLVTFQRVSVVEGLEDGRPVFESPFESSRIVSFLNRRACACEFGKVHGVIIRLEAYRILKNRIVADPGWSGAGPVQIPVGFRSAARRQTSAFRVPLIIERSAAHVRLYQVFVYVC